MPISISRGLMLIALFVLAYLVWITMTDSSESFTTSITQPIIKTKDSVMKMFESNRLMSKQENFKTVNPPAEVPQLAAIDKIIYNETPAPVAPVAEAPKINYENFEANVDGKTDTVHGAAPFGGKTDMDEGKYAKVSYTGMVDGKPGDVIQIEGTDLLTAPLVDNMLYTNSIANTNRNASNDLRGDIPLQFNDTYTPFYSSVIYGAPLSQKQMTIGKI